MSREALVIGINRYPLLKNSPTSPARNLLKPADDAEAIAQLLEKYGGFRVRRFPALEAEDGTLRVNPRPVPNQLPKAAQLEKAICLLFNPPSSVPETALLFFAGHGLLKEQGAIREGFLAASDSNPKRNNWGLSLNCLRQILEKSPVRQQIVWLDCCHSGALLNFDEADPGAKGKERDRCFIAASRDFESAYEDVAAEHSVFTTALLQGLDPSQQEANWTTNYSLVDFINKQLATSRQRPVFHNSGGEIVLTGKKEKIDKAVLMSEVCPYKGLEPFGFNEEDPKYFYGRTALTDQLLDKIRSGNFLAVVGASGSGKSSVVKAGLLHQLKLGQRLSGSETWPIRIFRPGKKPVRNLAATFIDPKLPKKQWLKQLDKTEGMLKVGRMGLPDLVSGIDASRLVLVVDQLEEVFTLCRRDEERQQFFECLLAADGVADVADGVTDGTDVADLAADVAADGVTDVADKLAADGVTDVADVAADVAADGVTDVADKLAADGVTDVADKLAADGVTDVADVAADGVADVAYLAADGTDVADLTDKLAADGTDVADLTDKLAADKLAADGTDVANKSRVRNAHQTLCSEPTIFCVSPNNLSTCQLTLVITMRADFFGKCAEREYAGLSDLIQENLVTVKPMTEEELTQAIQEPAKQVGLEMERELVKEMLADVSGPGSLPLLQYTLTELWRNREVNRLTLAEYSRLGGVTGTLQKRANEVYEDLTAAERCTAKRIFLELTQLGEGTEDTRRQVIKSQLETPQQPIALVDRVIEKLADARLVVTSQVQGRGQEDSLTTIDVAHEALIRHWQQLRQWVSENRAALRQKRNIEADAEEWLTKDKGKDYLLTGLKLAEAENFIKNNADTVSLSPLAKKCVSKSIQQRRKNRLLVACVAISFVWIVSTAAVVSTTQELQVERQTAIAEKLAARETARERALVAKNLLSVKPAEALAMAIETTGKSQDLLQEVLPEVRSILYDAVGIARERNLLKGHEGSVWSVAISPDGGTIVFGGADSTVRLSNKQGNQVGILRGHQDLVRSVAISPDGRTIASGSEDDTVRLWDLDGNQIGVLRGHQDSVRSVAFSPDGRTIASASEDNTIRLWNLDCNQIGVLRGHEDPVRSVAFSPDGRTIVSGSSDNTVRLWDLETGEPIGVLRGHQSWVNSVAISPDGRTIVSGSVDNTVRLWDLETGKQIGKPLRGHEDPVRSVAFSPDGRTIVSASEDNTIRLWDKQGNQIAEPLRGHQNWVSSVALSPDGRTIVSGSVDNTLRLWDKQGNQIGEPLRGHQNSVYSVAFSPDGQTIVSGSWDNTVRLWDRQGKQIGEPLRGHEGEVISVAISPDGKTIVSGSKDRTVRLWDLKTGKQIGEPLRGHEGEVISVAISPDGKTIVSGSKDRTVRLWDLRTGKPTGEPLLHEDYVRSVAISPDGQTIVSGSEDGTVQLWNPGTGKRIGGPLLGHEDWVNSVAFSPDGQTIVSAGDKTVRLWDFKTGKPIGEPLRGHNHWVNSVAFSPDGRTIVSGSWDKTVRLWRGGSWRDLLSVACNRLQNHPVLVEAKSEMAVEAGATCGKYVWNGEEGEF
ncbi:MAG: hypothetical protein F6J93_03400 [Oscillatoria sp. SIO1A7]|nr:hypothetical protein [Oscillatoria sp. SIO1A7]